MSAKKCCIPNCGNTRKYSLLEMSAKKCCIPNCGNTHAEELLHLFPNPNKEMDRLRTWIYAVDAEELLHLFPNPNKEMDRLRTWIYAVDAEELLHLFPNPNKEMDRFRTWIYAVGGDILALDNEKIFKLRRICHAHFEQRYHTSSQRLAANAVPTLNLPGSANIKRKALLAISNVGSTSKEIINPIALPVEKGNTESALKEYSHEVHWLKNKLYKIKKATKSTESRLKAALKLSENQIDYMKYLPIVVQCLLYAHDK